MLSIGSYKLLNSEPKINIVEADAELTISSKQLSAEYRQSEEAFHKKYEQ